jgi:hypothetical protein
VTSRSNVQADARRGRCGGRSPLFSTCFGATEVRRADRLVLGLLDDGAGEARRRPLGGRRAGRASSRVLALDRGGRRCRAGSA